MLYWQGGNLKSREERRQIASLEHSRAFDAEAVGIKMHKDTQDTRRNSRVKEEHNLRSERDAHARKRVRVNGPQRAASKSQLQFRAERTRRFRRSVA